MRSTAPSDPALGGKLDLLLCVDKYAQQTWPQHANLSQDRGEVTPTFMGRHGPLDHAMDPLVAKFVSFESIDNGI